MTFSRMSQMSASPPCHPSYLYSTSHKADLYLKSVDFPSSSAASSTGCITDLRDGLDAQACFILSRHILSSAFKKSGQKIRSLDTSYQFESENHTFQLHEADSTTDGISADRQLQEGFWGSSIRYMGLRGIFKIPAQPHLHLK